MSNSVATSSCDCPLCNFSSPSRGLWLSHLRSVHSKDNDFFISCDINGCGSSYSRCASFVSHINFIDSIGKLSWQGNCRILQLSAIMTVEKIGEILKALNWCVVNPWSTLLPLNCGKQFLSRCLEVSNTSVQIPFTNEAKELCDYIGIQNLSVQHPKWMKLGPLHLKKFAYVYLGNGEFIQILERLLTCIYLPILTLKPDLQSGFKSVKHCIMTRILVRMCSELSLHFILYQKYHLFLFSPFFMPINLTMDQNHT